VLLESDDDGSCGDGDGSGGDGDGDGSRYINFVEGNDSDVDFAQEEYWNYTDGVVEEVKNDDVAHVLTSYRGQKFPFSGQCGV
jgi:hypothetical protein